MTSAMSKRQQARNEKALQELVHNVPGNNICADCEARNPAWASWSLGIFLCMRCAAIHRKLGTHISKVKSLSMDGWSNEQVESMKRVGNIASNKIYNAEGKRPPVPVDADEADSAMERFIRSKYMQRAVSSRSNSSRDGAARHDTGNSVESDEGPPPPPKTGGKLFAKTSTFPLSFRSKKHQQQVQQHQQYFNEESSPRELRNKPPKLFGASVHSDSVEDTARKLTQLRDMGFHDDKHNAIVLKGVQGNLDKAVEQLVRLGEGGGHLSPGAVLARESSLLTPKSMASLPATPTTAGLTKASSSSTAQSPATSNNPWDISPAPPQSSQSTGTMPNKNPFYASNPFGLPTQQDLNASMQNLSLAPSTQQLFPHHTGGLPAPPPLQATYQQPMTPPISSSSDMSGFPFNTSQTYSQPAPYQQPQQQQQQPFQQSYNPFMQSLAPQQQLQPQQSQQSLTVNTTAVQNQGAFANNPFARSPTRLASPLNQIPEQAQQNFYGTPQSAAGSNPFFAMTQPMQQPQQPQPQFAQQPFDQTYYQMQQPQQAVPQSQPMYQPSRDKASIMALYNIPSAAPTPFQQPGQNAINGMASQPPTQPVPQASPQRSMTAPMSTGSNNPFMNAGAPPAPSPFSPANNAVSRGDARTRESMTLGLEMAWNNGRHSPDAFASLSARGA